MRFFNLIYRQQSDVAEMAQHHHTKTHTHIIQFFVDASASMYGAPLQAANESMILIHSILSELVAYPAENMIINIATFKAGAIEVVSKSTLADFSIPYLTVSGLSSIKPTLDYIKKVFEQSIPSITCLLTDGDFTDIYPAINITSYQHHLPQIPLVAILCGLQAHSIYLRNLTPYVLFSSQLSGDKLREIFDRFLHQSS